MGCRFCIEFPSGLLDPRESLLQAAERELAEETGYRGNIKVTYRQMSVC